LRKGYLKVLSKEYLRYVETDAVNANAEGEKIYEYEDRFIIRR
jgi:hypothetical protein